MLVETHVHTRYSKGERVLFDAIDSPSSMVEAAIRNGIDVLSISDHDTTRGVAEAKKAAAGKDIMIVQGEEISSSDGHVLAFGISERIAEGKSAEETIDAIREQAGLAIAPHPFDIYKKGVKSKAQLCDAVEVFNPLNIDRLSNRRSRKWVKDKKLVAVAGSDAHCKEMLGFGSLILPERYDSIDSVIKAIKNGKSTHRTQYNPLSTTLRWNVQRMQLSYDQVLDHIMKNYTGPKKHLSKWLLKSTKHSPGKIDYFYKLLAYIGISSSVIYSATKGRRIMEM
ncbi:MAG: PHP domain-containing protein [Candidatus Aenigmarchaeota archaeon]|nr:PHP domain-containing protein [Candidatus Aenigmarchaeota archaeon]